MPNTQTELKFFHTHDQHEIAYAVIGNPELRPILFLHGGPGASANPYEASLFNLNRYCVIMFDQRGCGRSTPSADIHNNTTQHLIQDIEQLRRILNIEYWAVYGGSWGATLALEYSKQHRQRVTSIILRGSFLARKQDLDWFIQPNGVAIKHPEAYQVLLAALSPAPEEPLTTRLYNVLKTSFQTSAYKVALAWDHWEATVMGTPKASAETNPQQQQKRIAAKLVYAHYCHHQFFLGEQGVMKDLHCLKGIPVTLIHGKNDQVCPLSAAKTLDAALPNSKLIVADAGHNLYEEKLKQALWQIVSHSAILL
ncbi:MAG: alpha/beta fold hydrolase [Thiolinea sp.]